MPEHESGPSECVSSIRWKAVLKVRVMPDATTIRMRCWVPSWGGLVASHKNPFLQTPNERIIYLKHVGELKLND